jgi:hypothetical protein
MDKIKKINQVLFLIFAGIGLYIFISEYIYPPINRWVWERKTNARREAERIKQSTMLGNRKISGDSLLQMQNVYPSKPVLFDTVKNIYVFTVSQRDYDSPRVVEHPAAMKMKRLGFNTGYAQTTIRMSIQGDGLFSNLCFYFAMKDSFHFVFNKPVCIYSYCFYEDLIIFRLTDQDYNKNGRLDDEDGFSLVYTDINGDNTKKIADFRNDYNSFEYNDNLKQVYYSRNINRGTDSLKVYYYKYDMISKKTVILISNDRLDSLLYLQKKVK